MACKPGYVPVRNPLDGTFELTVRCNLRCKMCLFRHDDRENPVLKANELTAAEWIDMARQAAEAGTFKLLITGGEPMLRPDFCEIWEGIYKYGFMITLYTNATLVTEKIMQTLRKYPPHKIGITIYGASADTYERVCGHADAFERAMQGARELQTLPSRLEFRTTIIKDNYDDFNELHRLVAERFGKQYNLIHTRLVTQAVRGACADVNTCRLEPEENIRLAYLRSIELIKEYVGDAYDERNVVIEERKLASDNVHAPRLTLFGCSAGMSQYTVSHDGKLLGCQMMDVFSQDVRKLGLAKAWEEYPRGVKLPPLNEKCQTCEDIKYCNTCCASRYAETGDLGGCPEYVCKDVAMMKKLIQTGGINDESNGV